MCSAVQQWRWFPDAQESCFRLRIVQKCAVSSRNLVNLLMLMYRVFKLRIVQIWAMLSWKDFDMLILCNRVFRHRNIQIWVVLALKMFVLLIFTNSLFQAAKCSNMDCVELQVCLFVDWQEWHLQVSKRSDNCSTIQQDGRFADFTNSGFRGRNVEICANLSSNEVDLLILRIRVFRLRIFLKCAVPSRNGVNLLMLRNRVFRLSGIAF